MNTVIIHTLRSRSSLIRSETQGCSKGQNQGQGQRNSEHQIYIMLLVVTFGFLILITPGYIVVFYVLIVDFTKSPKLYASYYFFYDFAGKLYYTNNGINFYLYVISGKKFREDLVKLFTCKKGSPSDSSVS